MKSTEEERVAMSEISLTLLIPESKVNILERITIGVSVLYTFDDYRGIV